MATDQSTRARRPAKPTDAGPAREPSTAPTARLDTTDRMGKGGSR